MSNFVASFWTNRWRRLAGVGFLACGLPLLHPFVRQSLFGPTIDGVAWCLWEEEVRLAADPARPKGWWMALLEKVGVRSVREQQLDIRGPSTLPLYLHLANDRDVKVRRFALEELNQRAIEKDEAFLDLLRQRINDEDPYCRCLAVCGIWKATRDPAMIAVLVPLKDEPNDQVRRSVVLALGDMASDDPGLFEPMSQLCEDRELNVRISAIASMHHFGKRGVPILRKAFADSHVLVRSSAVYAASELRADGAVLFPELRRLQESDADSGVRRNAGHALYMMDPKQFSKPTTWVD